MEGGGHHIQLPTPSDELGIYIGGCRKQLVDNRGHCLTDIPEVHVRMYTVTGHVYTNAALWP